MAIFGYYVRMSETLHSSILRALLVALKPLVRALLSAGVGYREFADVAKVAFIHEASNEFGLRGRPTNVSRVAIMTGIARKEVKRIRDASLDEYFFSPVRESPVAITLSRWHADSRFCDSAGTPKILNYDGPGDTFVQLVADFAGDLPAGAMRVELKRLGAIEELSNNRLRVLKRYFMPDELGKRLAIGLADIVAPSISTLAFNCDRALPQFVRHHRIVSIDDVPLSALSDIESEANDHLTKLEEQFDSYLVNTCSAKIQERDSKSGIQAGIGLFYFEREL
jgi:hypothetical protein